MSSNIKEYSYFSNIQISEHFKISEFRCKCGGTHSTKISENLIDKLEALFSKLNCSKIVVTSGYRCPVHDRNVGGNGIGQHTLGTAADVICYDRSGKAISSKIVSCVAQDLGFTGIGNINAKYQAIHLDVRSGSKWYGNEVVGTGTVTSDFYSYYSISKADLSKYTGVAAPTTTAAASNSSFDAAREFDKSIAGTYKVTATALNVRRGAGTNKTVAVTIPKDTTVQNYGYYTNVAGTKWMLIQFTYNGAAYTGFASGEYLRKA